MIDLRTHPNLPAESLNYALAYPQTEAKAAAARLCGEGGLKNSVEVIRGYAGSRVANFNQYPLARRKPVVVMI